MTDVRCFMWRASVLACLLLVVCTPVRAQEPLSAAPEHAQFLSRYDFQMSAALLGHPDIRYTWDTHWFGDLDLVDYTFGRITFLGDYQGLLGSEFRPFDPYQSNYTLEASGSLRLGKTEVIAVLNHISRHLGDRPKRQAVAENSLGLRVLERFHPGGGRTELDVRIDVRKVIAQAYVDYTWMNELAFTLRRPLNRHISGYLRLHGQVYAVDRTIAGRGDQYGGRVEAGIRLNGTAGSVELFVGGERMIDADPLERMPEQWALGGFRLRR
jgi:hypothetical protein